MSYPFAGFGTVLFSREEMPLPDTDVGWVRSPTYSRVRPLGSARDSILTLAIGSAERSWELYLTPARLAALEALLNSTATLVDWDRPVPDQRRSFLTGVEPQEFVAVACRDDASSPGTSRRIRTKLTWVSQA